MLPPSEDAHSNSNVTLPDSSNHNAVVSSHLNSFSSRSSSPNVTVVVDTLTPALSQEPNKNTLSVLGSSNNSNSNNSSNNSVSSSICNSNSNGNGNYHNEDSIVRANFVDFTLDISDNSNNDQCAGAGSFRAASGRSGSGSATASSSGDPAEEEEDEDEDKDFYNLSLNPDLHKIRAEQIRNWLEYENNHSNSNSLVSAGSNSGGEPGDESRDFEEDSLNLHDVVNLAGRNRRVRFLTDQEGNLLISVFLTNMIDDEEQQRLQALSQSQQNEINAEPVEVEENASTNGHSTPETVPVSQENEDTEITQLQPEIEMEINNNNNSPPPEIPSAAPEIIEQKTEETKEVIAELEESPPPLVFIVMEETKNEPNYAAMDKNMSENIISSSSDVETNEDSDNETDQEPELVKLTEETNDIQEFSDSETLSASSSCDSMIEIIPGANRNPIASTVLSLKEEMEMEYNNELSKIMDNCDESTDDNSLKVPDISLSSVDKSLSPVQELVDTNNNLSTASKLETICYDEADKSMTCFEYNPEKETVIVAEPENHDLDAAVVVHVEPKEDIVVVQDDIETEIEKLEREIEEEIKGRSENACSNLKFNPIIASEPQPQLETNSAAETNDIEEKRDEEAILSEPTEAIEEIDNDIVLEETAAPEENMNCPELVHEEDIREESPVVENTEENRSELLNQLNNNEKSEFQLSSAEVLTEPDPEPEPGTEPPEMDTAEQQLESLRVEEEPISSVALQIAKWESMAKKAPPKSIGSSIENLHNIGNGSNKAKLSGNPKSHNKNGTSPKPADCPTKSTVWNCWNKANKGIDDEEIIYAQPNNNSVMMTSLSNPSAVLKSHPKPSSRGEILNWFKDGEIHRAGLIISNNNTFGIHHSTINNNNSDGSPANIPVVVSWFFGLITRVQAEKFLHGQPTGTFLVRISTRIWGYTLSYQSNQRTKHFLISAQNPSAVPPSLQTEKDKSSSNLLPGSKNLPKPLLSPFASQGRYAFIGTNMTPYTTLASLIRHHSHAPITKSGGEKLLFPCPGGPNLTGVEYLFK